MVGPGDKRPPSLALPFSAFEPYLHGIPAEQVLDRRAPARTVTDLTEVDFSAGGGSISACLLS